jgi:hypothetical protein
MDINVQGCSLEQPANTPSTRAASLAPTPELCQAAHFEMGAEDMVDSSPNGEGLAERIPKKLKPPPHMDINVQGAKSGWWRFQNQAPRSRSSKQRPQRSRKCSRSWSTRRRGRAAERIPKKLKPPPHMDINVQGCSLEQPANTPSTRAASLAPTPELC